jgi:hypothetical protein
MLGSFGNNNFPRINSSQITTGGFGNFSSPPMADYASFTSAKRGKKK